MGRGLYGSKIHPIYKQKKRGGKKKKERRRREKKEGSFVGE